MILAELIKMLYLDEIYSSANELEITSILVYNWTNKKSFIIGVL